MPVVLSLAVVGFIAQLSTPATTALLNAVLGRRHPTDWLGDPDINIWAVLVAGGLAACRLRDDPLPGRAQGASTRR